MNRWLAEGVFFHRLNFNFQHFQGISGNLFVGRLYPPLPYLRFLLNTETFGKCAKT